MAQLRDEVSYSDYLKACRRLERCGDALAHCAVDEAAEHWLPELTRHIAIIFSFVGSNMTARHTNTYYETTAALQAAKDGVHSPPNNEEA